MQDEASFANKNQAYLKYQRRPGDAVFRVQRINPWRVSIKSAAPRRRQEPSLMILLFGFAAIIGVGATLLWLPISNKSGEWTPFVDAVFTAASAVCVTGLAVYDTLDYWNGFGQAIILILIQLGGFGFMTSTTVLLVALGRRIGLRERLLIGESMGINTIGGLIRLVKSMLLFTFTVEFIGAGIFFVRFYSDYPILTALWKAIFQSISAFNNAGFDIFGGFRSMTGHNGDYFTMLTTAALVILGGISFFVVQDVLSKRSLHRATLDTKLVLSVTAGLILMGTLVVLLTEYANPDTLGDMTLGEKFLNAFFQSITSRTAGFSAINTANMANYALFFIMLLMFIGGAAGSTAGGIKVNTFGIIYATIWSSIKGKEHPGAFEKEFMEQQVFRALAVIMISTAIVSVVVFALTITEKFGFLEILFESVSAFGTVGLTMGITPELSTASKIILALTMFAGRLGPLTITLALIKRQQPTKFRYPRDVVRIG